jgi:hypothetical protein
MTEAVKFLRNTGTCKQDYMVSQYFRNLKTNTVEQITAVSPRKHDEVLKSEATYGHILQL